jgi:hypothetical protein
LAPVTAADEAGAMSVEAPSQDAPRTRSGDTARASRTSLRPVSTVDAMPAPPDRTPALHTVSVTVTHGRGNVAVEVHAGPDQALGVAEGACAGGGTERLVAEAAVRAVAAIDPAVGGVAVEAVVLGPVGGRQAATVALAHPRGSVDEPLVGIELVGPAGTADAVARAVLDALSRRSTPL